MISERARLVTGSYVVSDVVATATALVAAHTIRQAIGPLNDYLGPVFPLDRYLPLLGFILPLWLVVFYASGLYGRRASRTLRTEVSRLVTGVGIAALLLFSILFAAKLDYVSRPVVALFLLLNGLLVEGGRALVRG